MLALYARRNAESKWSQDQLKRLHEIQQEQKQLLEFERKQKLLAQERENLLLASSRA
jgi:hypothetical protein